MGAGGGSVVDGLWGQSNHRGDDLAGGGPNTERGR